MSESGHPSLPSYPTLPPSELDQLQDLSSLDSNMHPSYSPSTRHQTASHPQPVSSVGGWFAPPTSEFQPSASPNLYTGHGGLPQQLVGFPSSGLPPSSPVGGASSTAQQHSALHMYSQGGGRKVTPPSSSSVGSPIPSSPSSSSSPHLRIHYLEQLCMTYKREKDEREEEFGRQRKVFMNHMTELDNEISLTKQTNLKLSEEVRDLSTQLLYKDEELKSIAAASKITEAQHREAFDADRVKYEEEIASLRQILDVQRTDQSSALTLEQEKWKQERSALLNEIHQLKGRSLSPNSTPLLPVSSTESNENSRTASPEDSLESSMIRAAEDSKILRAVIIPLEEEIDLLKTKLSEAEERIKLYESQGAISSSVSPERDVSAPLINLESPVPPANPRHGLPTSPSPTSTDPNKQLQNLLELERAATHDLEMHTKQLKNQKAYLQSEMTQLTKNLDQVNNDLQVERNRYIELKKTWELANTHFIAAQDQLKAEIGELQQKLQEKGGGGGKVEALLLGRTSPLGQKKSLSSEALDISGVGTVGSQAKAASWCNLHQSSYANIGKVWELSSRVSKLESELATARAEAARLEGVRLGVENQCSRYESQLHRVQAQMVEEMDGKERTIDKLRAEMEKYKAGIMRERQLRHELRSKMDNTREEMKTRIEKSRGEENQVSQQLRILSDRFTEIKIDTQKEIARLVQERANLYQQIESVREEYECLKVVQATGINDYQAQLTHATMNQKEAELNLQSTMNRLTMVEQEKQVAEESLATQLTLAREELMTAQSNCEQLKKELAISKDKLITLEAVQLVLQEERRAKEEMMSSKDYIQRRSKEFIENQQKKMEELNSAKASSDKQVKELQHQLGLLKSQLSHSEETQKDFVELSQSLQMRLAEIEDQQDQDSAPTQT